MAIGWSLAKGAIDLLLQNERNVPVVEARINCGTSPITQDQDFTVWHLLMQGLSLWLCLLSGRKS